MQLTITGALRGETPPAVLRRMSLIALISFLTLIDLFAMQALAPQLTAVYGVSTATMGLALNLATVGMAVAGLSVAWFSDRIDRSLGIWLSLMLLAVPTALLSVTTDITLFMVLRMMQGACMATAFTLTMTYLSEECSITAAAGAMAAYITGNVASNLFGRLLASEVAAGIGIADTFLVFAALNMAGALIAIMVIGPRSAPQPAPQSTTAHAPSGSPWAAWRTHLANPALRAAFAIGFLILFVFVGIFTYVNFELVDPAIGLTPTSLGLVYFVFLPSLVTTPLAGNFVARLGPRPLFWVSSALSVGGVALTMTGDLVAILAGMAVIAVGTFQMQAAATAFVGRAATTNRAAANGLYLTSYYVGGLAGAVVIGQAYDIGNWTAAAWVTIVALASAALLARQLRA
ncbi:MAG: MFS transporter [Pseudomonadota bacterium]